MIFTIYSKNGCQFCDKIQKVMELSELKHFVYKLDRDFDREEFYDRFGDNSTFPQVILDNKIIGGCTETVNYLREQKLV